MPSLCIGLALVALDVANGPGGRGMVGWPGANYP